MILLRRTNLKFENKFLVYPAKGLALLLALSAFLGCGSRVEMSEAERRRLEFCKPVQAAHVFDEIPFKGGSAKILSFQSIRANINSACASCHRVPAANKGFSYLDEWKGREETVAGKTEWYPGFYEAADKMRDYIFHADEKLRMPPKEYRDKNPESFLEMGRQLEFWITAGKPEGTFEAGKVPQEREGKFRPVRPKQTSDLGDCVPTAKAIGHDYGADRFFATTDTLPKYLIDTDLFTLDPYLLATHGTIAYNVEHPLWADNAEKGRWIHVPMKYEDGELKKQSIEYDSAKQQFHIPENSRFYKSFYRAVKLPNGKTRMRRMETRIIVNRTPWEKSLFGTYQWDETEQVATLVEAPYRDGTPFKDLIFDVTVDEAKEVRRPYAIPGRQRCIDCHMGSPTQNFVLGFTPIQINKRTMDVGGRIDPAAAHDLNQVQRFIEYGLISGLRSAAELPRLENMGQPRNIYELQANHYTIGNCYHCHNPKGLAFTKENGVDLELGPGALFQFSTNLKSTQFKTRRFVHQNGELDSSHLWRKITDSNQGMFSRMPMHTPGSPDCRAMTVVGKWIRSFESVQAAENWDPGCKKSNPFDWIDLDLTWPNAQGFVPRRNDWKDPADGMPEKYRNIELTPSLKQAITSEYPVGHWLKKPECTFPVVDLPEDKRRPWMMNGGKPKRPFGEVYYTTPGSYFFRDTCMKCHGAGADGDSTLARGILLWSGGAVRVANFVGDAGMFGKNNDNLKTLELNGKDLSGNYLIWMAMEGTRVKFPPELSSFLGRHGGQMLNGIREKCLMQVASGKKSSPRFPEHEVFNQVCFMENLRPGHPDLAFDPNTDKPVYPQKVEDWLDRGAWNAGWAIYEFLKDAARGNWRPAVDQCDIPYGPKTAGKEGVP